ncbi:MAG: hypothetical protein IJ074_09960, partial [Clostridia bacterium]|nr:hypothetical protein [Clostridia bacterium]
MGTITIIGHGWQVGDLTLNAIDAFRQADTVLLHTERCACAQWLAQNGIAYRALDALYDSADDFDAHAQSAAQEVLRCAENSDVAYGVFDLRDRSVERLLSSDAAITCVAGPSLESALAARVSGTVRVIEASDWEHCHISSSDATLVREIDTRELAAEVKLRLMETYPDEWTIYVSTGERG